MRCVCFYHLCRPGVASWLNFGMVGAMNSLGQMQRQIPYYGKWFSGRFTAKTKPAVLWYKGEGHGIYVTDVTKYGFCWEEGAGG